MDKVRRLVSIRRLVPTTRLNEYLPLWIQLQASAKARGAHAWHFLSADVEGVVLEFLEFGADSDIRADTETLAAIKALHDTFGDVYPMPNTLEEWVEIPSSIVEGV